MYTYYALRALKFNPPRFISMLITGLQLTQMIIGCAINIWAYDFLQQSGSHSCQISLTNIKLSIAMYASYFILFARFFHLTYLSSNARKGKRHVTSATTSQQPKQLDSKIKAQ
jgi:elongation of very long chain fatty acids protein 6